MVLKRVHLVGGVRRLVERALGGSGVAEHVDFSGCVGIIFQKYGHLILSRVFVVDCFQVQPQARLFD